MNTKTIARVRRAARSRRKIKEMRVPRLCIHRTPQHIYAQLISADGAQVVACASTLEKTLREKISGKNKTERATLVGAEVAKRILAAGVKRVAFDRSGFKYHGRVKALADAARDAGLEF